MKLSHFDLRVNLFITAAISISILICAGSVIFGTGAVIEGAADMAYQLTPLLGQYAGVLFALGLWAAGFSSGLFNISVQPALFGQAFGTSEKVNALPNRIMMLLAAIVPILIVYLFGQTPIQLIMAAQAINGLLLPAIVGSIWILCNKRKFLGEYANTLSQNIIYTVVMVIVCFLAIRVFLDIFGII